MKTTPLGCPPIDTWCTAASASVRNSTYTKNRIKGEGGLTRRCKLLFAEKPTDPRCGRSYQLAARSQRARRNQHVRWLVPQRESLQHRSSWWPKKHEIIGNFVSFHFTSAKSHIPTARAHLLHLVMRGLFGAAAATATLFALLLPATNARSASKRSTCSNVPTTFARKVECSSNHLCQGASDEQGYGTITVNGVSTGHAATGISITSNMIMYIGTAGIEVKPKEAPW